MNVKFFRFLFTLLLASMLLSACSGAGLGSAPVSSKPPLRVEFTQWWSDYTVAIAKEKGFFDKYGVNVEPVYYANFPQALTDLPGRKIDGGLLAIGDALITSQSADLTVVAVYDDGGTNTVVASPEVTSIADLKGQRIGVPIATSYELFVRYMLEKNGMKPTDVTTVNLQPEDVAAHLASKDIMAGYVWYPSLAEGYQTIFQKSDAPGLFPDVIVFRQDVVKERPDDIRAFLKAWFEAVDYRQKNPEEARQIAAKYTNLPLDQIAIDDTIHIMTLQDNLTLFQPEGANGTFSLPQATKTNAEFQAEAGTMSKMPDFASFLDASFLK